LFSGEGVTRLFLGKWAANGGEEGSASEKSEGEHGSWGKSQKETYWGRHDPKRREVSFLERVRSESTEGEAWCRKKEDRGKTNRADRSDRREERENALYGRDPLLGRKGRVSDFRPGGSPAAEPGGSTKKKIEFYLAKTLDGEAFMTWGK